MDVDKNLNFFVKMQKKIKRVSVDVKEELKFL